MNAIEKTKNTVVDWVHHVKLVKNAVSVYILHRITLPAFSELCSMAVAISQISAAEICQMLMTYCS